MNRISLVQNHLGGTKKAYVDSAYDFLSFDDLLTPAHIALRKSVREFAEREIAPRINEYIERAAFPDFLIQPLREFGLLKKFLQKPYGEGLDAMSLAVTVVELARVDASVMTFFVVQLALVIHTIELFGSDEQKNRYLEKLSNLEIIGGWGLTEIKIGSDASSLQTTVTKVPGGYRLNGDKRWIGNGNRDIVVVWARDSETKKVGAYIVNMKSEGVTSTVIKNKLALRSVQNCEIRFNNVFIPEEEKLPKATDFNATNQILRHSRVFVPWAALGVCIGTYDNAIKYLSERKQFGVPLTSFQLVQEKLTRMMGSIQAIMMFNWLTTKRFEQDKITIGQIALNKAWATLRGREVVALGRELLGGNGIVLDNYVIKAMADMEAIYTYEGTYDINALVAGRELTGIPAFKVPTKQ
eukprot:TRINITY_DN2928_c0_g3_i1.p1 TRINITY_DN2928_c0_g3~~TRINITY_DN2928_c0_g3_i1.p1  ORF type:complete len:411 (+),score=95.07 TRINITY_DN2928_c0_g3_i1:117-1349(+)